MWKVWSTFIWKGQMFVREKSERSSSFRASSTDIHRTEYGFVLFQAMLQDSGSGTYIRPIFVKTLKQS